MAAARYPISERGWACGRHCRSKPGPDQTRARELRLYRATLPKNTTIGTSGWHLSPLLYGYQLNRRTGFESVLVANKPSVTLSRGPLPGQPESPLGLGVSDHCDWLALHPQGDSLLEGKRAFLPIP